MPNIDPDKSWAVLIGVSRFPQDPEHLLPLPAVSNNVDGLFEALAAPDIGGLRPDHIVRIVDERGADIATKLAREADKAEDTLIVYYAGHGLPGGTRLYLAGADTTEAEVEFNGIEFTKFREAIMRSPAPRKVLILDCCYSGRATEWLGSDRSFVQAQIEDVEGTYVLASSAGNVPSVAPENARYTAFTGELLDLLCHGIDNNRPTITLRELYRDLRLAIRKRTGLPEPQQAHSALAGELILARNRRSGLPPQGQVSGRDTEPVVEIDRTRGSSGEAVPEPRELERPATGRPADRVGLAGGHPTVLAADQEAGWTPLDLPPSDRSGGGRRRSSVLGVAAACLALALATTSYFLAGADHDGEPELALTVAEAPASETPSAKPPARPSPAEPAVAPGADELAAALTGTSWQAFDFEVWEDRLKSDSFWYKHFLNERHRDVNLVVRFLPEGTLVVESSALPTAFDAGWRTHGTANVDLQLSEEFQPSFAMASDGQEMAADRSGAKMIRLPRTRGLTPVGVPADAQ